MSTLDQNSLAIIGILIAWIIYRLGAYSERKGILSSLKAELSLHEIWMSGVYHEGQKPNPSWSDKSYLVYKLSTTAIDNAIGRGALLILNKDLLKNITYYRQMLERFNQLIDSAMTFQANADLWLESTKVDPMLIERMTMLTKQIHVSGIGNNDEPTRYGHYFFEQVNKDLKIEENMYVSGFIWFLFNLNLYPLKKFICKFI